VYERAKNSAPVTISINGMYFPSTPLLHYIHHHPLSFTVGMLKRKYEEECDG